MDTETRCCAPALSIECMPAVFALLPDLVDAIVRGVVLTSKPEVQELWDGPGPREVYQFRDTAILSLSVCMHSLHVFERNLVFLRARPDTTSTLSGQQITLFGGSRVVRFRKDSNFADVWTRALLLRRFVKMTPPRGSSATTWVHKMTTVCDQIDRAFLAIMRFDTEVNASAIGQDPNIDRDEAVKRLSKAISATAAFKEHLADVVRSSEHDSPILLRWADNWLQPRGDILI